MESHQGQAQMIVIPAGILSTSTQAAVAAGGEDAIATGATGESVVSTVTATSVSTSVSNATRKFTTAATTGHATDASANDAPRSIKAMEREA